VAQFDLFKSTKMIRAGLAIAVISTVGTRSELVDRIEV
jgi:hypothetical protein